MPGCRRPIPSPTNPTARPASPGSRGRSSLRDWSRQADRITILDDVGSALAPRHPKLGNPPEEPASPRAWRHGATTQPGRSHWPFAALRVTPREEHLGRTRDLPPESGSTANVGIPDTGGQASPDDGTRINLAITLDRAGQVDETLTPYSATLEVHP